MPNRRDALKSAALLPLAAVPIAARGAMISGAPMAGHFTHESVRIWAQATEETGATLAWWPASASESDAKSKALRFTKAAGLCAIEEIRGLQPATRYLYKVAFEGGGGSPIGAFRTAPAPGAAVSDFRVYLGSCAYTEAYTRGGNPYGANHQVFDTMAGRMTADALPHFMLWLGDNLYFRGPSTSLGIPSEYGTPAHMELRYKDVRSQLQLRRLFAATHHYATWDDHDYGDNNSDKSFALKDTSLKLFRAYWPNPDREADAPPGIWCRFTHQDAEFFLLDNRFYRDAEKAPPDPAKAMFGKIQMDWLKRSLAASKATFKLVVAGTQFLSEAPNGEESGWHSYPNERDDFLAWLAREKINVTFISGDRHNTQLFRLTPAIQEFSCSPMTSKIIKLSKTEWANPRLERECAVETQNYGTLEFSGTGRERAITARCFDADGKPLWNRVLARAG